MIGFYDYTVVLTYVSLASSLIGIFCALSAQPRWAIFFLAFSGLCDMFDGKIARTKKNRTEDEKNFGIQIDSLCDIVCFGVFPIVICYKLGMNHIYSMVILIFYGLAGLIRLAYFNVLEARRQSESDDAGKFYRGLPITSMAIALPIFFVVSPLLPSQQTFMVILHILVVVIGILFITDFKLRKPTTIEVLITVAVVFAAVVVIVFVWHEWWRLLRFGSLFKY